MDVKTALHEDHIERSRGESLSTKRSPPDAKLDRQNAPFKAQKSKGGRKPVCCIKAYLNCDWTKES